MLLSHSSPRRKQPSLLSQFVWVVGYATLALLAASLLSLLLATTRG